MRSEGSCSVWFMKDTGNSHSCKASNVKASGVTAGGKRDFVYCHLWRSGQILALKMLSLSLDYFYLQRKIMAATTCNLQEFKRQENLLLKQPLGNPKVRRVSTAEVEG